MAKAPIKIGPVPGEDLNKSPTPFLDEVVDGSPCSVNVTDMVRLMHAENSMLIDQYPDFLNQYGTYKIDILAVKKASLDPQGNSYKTTQYLLAPWDETTKGPVLHDYLTNNADTKDYVSMREYFTTHSTDLSVILDDLDPTKKAKALCVTQSDMYVPIGKQNQKCFLGGNISNATVVLQQTMRSLFKSLLVVCEENNQSWVSNTAILIKDFFTHEKHKFEKKTDQPKAHPAKVSQVQSEIMKDRKHFVENAYTMDDASFKRMNEKIGMVTEEEDDTDEVHLTQAMIKEFESKRRDMRLILDGIAGFEDENEIVKKLHLTVSVTEFFKDLGMEARLEEARRNVDVLCGKFKQPRPARSDPKPTASASSDPKPPASASSDPKPTALASSGQAQTQDVLAGLSSIMGLAAAKPKDAAVNPSLARQNTFLDTLAKMVGGGSADTKKRAADNETDPSPAPDPKLARTNAPEPAESGTRPEDTEDDEVKVMHETKTDPTIQYCIKKLKDKTFMTSWGRQIAAKAIAGQNPITIKTWNSVKNTFHTHTTTILNLKGLKNEPREFNKDPMHFLRLFYADKIEGCDKLSDQDFLSKFVLYHAADKK